MNAFDKVCAALAFVLGVVFVVLGVFGLFFGCNAHFTLPPILGVFPAIVGWGIVRAVLTAWRVPRRGHEFLMTPHAHADEGMEPSADR